MYAFGSSFSRVGFGLQLNPLLLTLDIDSIPPHRKQSPHPAEILADAVRIACIDDPHSLLMVEPGTSAGRPPRKVISRPML